MKRSAILVFGLLAYMVFLLTFLYLVAFTGTLQATALAGWLPVLATLVPRSVDVGGPVTPLGQGLGWAVFAAGFATVLLSTFLIDHFDLFGLRQVWLQFVGRPAPGHRFVTPLFYRLVRHPLYLGFILALWGGPAMSIGHALFAGSLTLYILVAIRFEERDLMRQLGEPYVAYRQRVPMLVPFMGRRPKAL